jgi:hypothetical protein
MFSQSGSTSGWLSQRQKHNYELRDNHQPDSFWFASYQEEQMSKRRKVFGTALVLVIVLTGVLVLITASAGPNLKLTQAVPETAPQTSPAAFTLSVSHTVTRPDGQERLISTQQRFQRSDGTYKLVQTFYALDGTTERVQTIFGFIGLGVFRLDEEHKRLVFIGPQIDDRTADVEQSLHASDLLAREEFVAGVRAVVWRQAGRRKKEFVEEYRAPSLGGLVIKRVKVSALGRETVEPTAIELGEPAPGLFSELLSYPVDYSSYERQVEETEQSEPEIALLMRQMLGRMREARP